MLWGYVVRTDNMSRVLYQHNDYVSLLVRKIVVVIELLLIDEDYYVRVEVYLFDLVCSAYR